MVTMELKELFLIEIDGITKTITDYTTDNFVISYANKLQQLKYPEDNEQIQLICTRLKDWYDNNLQEITTNQFIHNLDAHMKSYDLINQIVNNI